MHSVALAVLLWGPPVAEPWVPPEPSQPAPAPAPAPAPPPAPVYQAPPGPEGAPCLGDAHCRHPFACVQGTCAVTTTYLDALEIESDKLLTHGANVLATGGILATFGWSYFGTSFALGGEEEADGLYMMVTGLVFAPVGTLMAMTGGMMLIAGRVKNRRVHHYRSRSTAARRPRGPWSLSVDPRGGVALMGRF